MNSGQRKLLMCVIGLLLAFALFWIGINNIFIMLAVLIMILVLLIVLKRLRPDLFSLFFKRKKNLNAEEEHKEPFTPKVDKTYVVLSGGSESDICQITVDRPVYRIGRANDCNYVLSGKGISRHHLRIEYQEFDGICYAIDEDSANGSYLNSGKMDPGMRYRLTQGDRLMIDDRAFTVEYAHY